MGPDQLEQLRVDGRPDRAPRGFPALQWINGRGRGVIGLDHRFDRDVDLEVELLAYAGVDHATFAVGSDHEAPHLLERILSRRQSDPLNLVTGRLGQPFQRQRQV